MPSYFNYIFIENWYQDPIKNESMIKLNEIKDLSDFIDKGFQENQKIYINY